MTTKRIIFITMCALLLLTLVMTGIVAGRVGQLLQGFGNQPTEPPQTTRPSDEDPTESTGQTQPSESTQPSETTPPATGHTHDYVLSQKQEATCTTAGYSLYLCDCGDILIPEEEQTPALGHSFNHGKVVAPTCTEGGWTEYECTRCGEQEKRNETEPAGHKFKETQVPPTCTEDGYTELRCTRDGCGEVQVGEVIEGTATGHEWVSSGIVEPTCTEKGYEAFACKNCDATDRQNETQPAGHSFGQWEDNGSGVMERTCDGCGITERADELVITHDQFSDVTDRKDKTYRLYRIHVGTESTPDLCTYTISDYLGCEDLSYIYDVEQGLVITYTDAKGDTREVVLPPLSSAATTIEANGGQSNG